MKFSLVKRSTAALILGLGLSAASAQAQQSVRTSVQQGNGAFVHKTDKAYCIGNSELGVPGIPATDCINLTQTKFIITPSGNSTSILVGKIPAGVTPPAQRVVFNSTYTETAEGPTKGRVYDTVAVTEPDGTITYTGTLRTEKGKGKGKK